MKAIQKKIFHVLTLLNLITTAIYAQNQNPCKISGLLSDEKGHRMEYATITLVKATDSSLVRGTLTAVTGVYLFNQIPSGRYMVKAIAMGYLTAVSVAFDVSAEHPVFTVPDLILQISSNSLSNITITAMRPTVERKIDRTVMNVENSVLAAGNSAMEILARAPGVTIDKDDNISLNGKAGVNVMINDKMTYLSAAQLSILLRSTDGTTVKTIELMTNPSAKYDASGNAGIINIKLKKNMQDGTSGSVTLGAGYGKHGRENGTFTLNHKEGKLNIFGSVSHSDVKNETDISQQRVVTDSGGGKTYFDQHALTGRLYHNNSYRVGADLNTGTGNILGFLANGYFNSSGSTGNSLTNIGQQPDLINSYQNQLSTIGSQSRNFSLNLNDKLKLDTAGQELSFDVDYSRFNYHANAQYNTDFYLPEGTTVMSPVLLREQTPSVITIHSAKLDYTLPLSKALKLEAGGKFSDVKTANNLEAQRAVNGTYMNDSTLSNRFIYEEKIAAGYTNLSATFHNTSIQAGLRAEHTTSEGNLINTGEDVKRRYINFFPSLFINQKINDKNEVGLSYSKRIDRPGYDNLNPFIYYLDQYTYSKGNPFLNPQYTNKFELNYTLNHSMNVGLGYSHSYNYLTNVSLTDAVSKITVATTLNLKNQNFYNVNLNTPYTLTKWWKGNVNAVAYYSSFKSDSLLGGLYNRGQVSFHLNASQNFQVAKNYRAELMTNYDSPFIYGIYHFNHNVYNDLGISHAFNDKKANLKLSVSDIFNTSRTYLTSNFQANNITLCQKPETRITRLTFTYNFGNTNIKAHQHTSGADNEKSRVSI